MLLETAPRRFFDADISQKMLKLSQKCRNDDTKKDLESRAQWRRQTIYLLFINLPSHALHLSINHPEAGTPNYSHKVRSLSSTTSFWIQTIAKT